MTLFVTNYYYISTKRTTSPSSKGQMLTQLLKQPDIAPASQKQNLRGTVTNNIDRSLKCTERDQGQRENIKTIAHKGHSCKLRCLTSRIISIIKTSVHVCSNTLVVLINMWFTKCRLFVKEAMGWSTRMSQHRLDIEASLSFTIDCY